eukprot:superscaffoldBa00001511_g10882
MPKDSRAKRKRMREAKRRARAAESDEARAARLASNAARNAKRRAEEPPEIRAERLASNATRIAKKRAEERWERDLQHHTRMQEEYYLAQLAERRARDAVRYQQVLARLDQVHHYNRNLARYDDPNFFQEELQGNYISKLRPDWFSTS